MVECIRVKQNQAEPSIAMIGIVDSHRAMHSHGRV